MSEKNYRKLQKRVYEIIYPGGIPLEFGCEIQMPDTFLGQYIGLSMAGNWILYAEFIKGCRTVKPSGKALIMGRPLEMSDFLKAWSICVCKKGCTDDLHVYDVGNHIAAVLDAPFQCVPEIKINIRLSVKSGVVFSFKNQSKEVLKRLYDLLVE
jgi:hypothetical protein